MPLNIVESSRNGFGYETLGKLGKYLGLDPEKTGKALGMALPALVGGLAAKSSTAAGAEDILNVIRNGGFGEETLKGLGAALAGGEGTKGLEETGSGILEGIFRDKLPDVVEWISGRSGVGKSIASSLLALAVPAVLGTLGAEVKRLGLDAKGLTGLLSGQEGFLRALAPAGLETVLGVESFSELSETGGKCVALAKWVLPLVLLAAVLGYMLKTCSMPPSGKTSAGAPGQAACDSGPGKFLSVKLPGGVDLNVPELGVEKKLIGFLEDAGRPVDKMTWFTFDRLEFETGSATLKSSSAEQLKNIAAILKAYPKVALKIGGYTDNVGDPVANVRLSRARAENTVKELVGLGVDAKRLEAEGYGDRYPVASNSTEEGRQRNRRIDLRVTAK